MATLIRVGFFREMHHGRPDDASIADEPSVPPGPKHEQIIAYLQAGHQISSADRPDTERDSTSQDALLTDGRFVWSSELAGYMQTHHIDIPAEFRDHMAALSFQVPSHVDVNALSLPEGDTDDAADALDAQKEQLKELWTKVATDLDLAPIRQQFTELAGTVKGFFSDLISAANAASANGPSAAQRDSDSGDESGVHALANALHGFADWLREVGDHATGSDANTGDGTPAPDDSYDSGDSDDPDDSDDSDDSDDPDDPDDPDDSDNSDVSAKGNDRQPDHPKPKVHLVSVPLDVELDTTPE